MKQDWCNKSYWVWHLHLQCSVFQLHVTEGAAAIYDVSKEELASS